MEFTLPANLAAGVEHDLSTGTDRRAWAAELPSIVDSLAARWSLTVGKPFEPGGHVSWVAPAHTAAGESLVLKVGWRHREALYEAAGLRTWAGHGAVRLIDSSEFDQTIALLLEACEPGNTLGTTLPPLDQDEVIAEVLRGLWIEPPADDEFPTLQSMCDDWADEFEKDHAASTAAGRPAIDAGIARAGAELFRLLPSTADRRVLLCTDLHPGNILSANREPWLMIDPKPHVGDPTYDAIQYMLNHPDRLADPEQFAARLADLLGVDENRLCQWLFARCVQESVDWPSLADIALALAPVALR